MNRNNICIPWLERKLCKKTTLDCSDVTVGSVVEQRIRLDIVNYLSARAELKGVEEIDKNQESAKGKCVPCL